ncbi:MAG: hypothetical protein ACXW0Z_01025 [Gemmatirosa sp.]
MRDVPDPPPAAPPLAPRLAVCALAALWALACMWHMHRHTGRPSDFDVVWRGARLLLEGQDPWALIGPGRAHAWVSPLYYPGTALLALAPLGLLPLEVARALWIGGGAALLAWAVTRDGWWRLPLFLSAPFFNAAGGGQWSILVAAAMLMPSLGVVSAMKPTVGLAVLAGMRTQRAQLVALAAGIALLAASLVVAPGWPTAWRAAIADAPHMSAPIAHWRVGAPLVLLALLRWRRPEARWLLALACVPQSTIVYEGLYFLLFPRTLRGVTVMAIASFGALWLQDRISAWAPTTAALQWAVGDVLIVFFYLPALVLVLRRANAGEVPRWLDVLVQRAMRTARRVVPLPAHRSADA